MALSRYDIEVDLDHRPDTSHALLVELTGANKRVLDVGCDTGYLGEVLTTHGCQVAGVEIDERTAGAARERLTEVVVADLESVELVDFFGPERFDVVIFGDVLEHLRDPLPVLRRARRLLAPGGSVLISTPNVAHGDIRLALLQGRWRYTKLGILDQTHTRFFTKDSLVAFLADAGFVLADLRRTRAPLFGTETEVDESDFPPELVAKLRDDDEATTYQFVLRAVPDDAAVLQSDVALRADALAAQLASVGRQLDEVRAELTVAQERFAAERAELLAALEQAREQPSPQPVAPPSRGRRQLRHIPRSLARRIREYR